MRPWNDTALVQLDEDKYGVFTASNPTEKIETGTVISVSERIVFLSSFSWVLENVEPEALEHIRQHYADLVGKRVRWEERADVGTSFEHEGKRFAFIKLTKILGVVE